MNLIIMGAPGAGKGTQAELISKRERIPAISTGQILRGAMSAGTELGLRARRYVECGALVPDDVVIGIVRDYLESDECRNGFILDGFPRSTVQAEALSALGVRIDAVLLISVSDERIVRRMGGRRVCKCGASYHVDYLPPAREGICDKCGECLFIRDDDRPETVTNRLKVFHDNTEPLIEYYRSKGLLVEVEGQEQVEDTTELVRQALLLKCGG
ncbi:MAG: adenylate kinase [Clostridia bacterium]|nr:adenylate kinase [Clostridia bacterium]